MRRFLQRFPSLAARNLIHPPPPPPTILRHPKIINPRVVVVPSLLNRVTSRFAFFSSESNSARGDEVVSKEELKKRIQSFLEDGDEDALPDLFEAMMKRKLSGKHDESDDEVMEEVRKYPINDDARKSDGGDSSDSDVESDDDLSDADSSDSDVEIDDLEDGSDWSDDSDVEIDGGDSPDSDIEFDGLKDVDLSGRGIKFNDGLKDVDLSGLGIKINGLKDGDLSGPGIEINGPKDGNLSGFDVKIDGLKPDHSSYSDSESD